MKTTMLTKEVAHAERNWHLIDASDRIVGRLASEIAIILRGKHKPIFSPNVDVGDFVVVINAGNVCFTGKKAEQKIYQYHTGYVGGLKTTKVVDLLRDKPEEILLKAVKKMLPKNSLGRSQFKKLKVYAGAQHPHAAQINGKIQGNEKNNLSEED